MRYAYIAVEGPHDLEFVARLLKHGHWPFAVGVVLDADDTEPDARFSSICAHMGKKGLSTPSRPATMAPGPPRCGVFVLPDNKSLGTLEDILLECAGINYPRLLQRAEALVGSIDMSEDGLKKEGLITKEDRKLFSKPAGPKKATVSCISAVLRPGMALQNTIHFNRWLEGEALTLARVAAVQRFLTDLLAD